MSAKTKAKKPNRLSKQEEQQKARRNTIITMVVCACLAIIIIVPVVRSEIQRSKDRIYIATDNLTITLRDNGTFIARLAHETKTGTYTIEDQMGFDVITFTSDGESVGGLIMSDVLYLPEAWNDGHGHGVEFELKK